MINLRATARPLRIEQALPVFRIQDLLQFTNLFPQLRDLLERFFLAHSGRVIGVYFGKADFLPGTCGDDIRFHLRSVIVFGFSSLKSSKGNV